jgi:ribosomal protein L10
MNRDEKAATIEEVAAQIEAAEAIFAVDYRGISAGNCGRPTPASGSSRTG